MEEIDHKGKKREEIFSRTVRAGKRTYFFDVRATYEHGYYVSITESKKKFESEDGKFHFEKHKLFLYKEDFETFAAALKEVMEFAKTEFKPVSEIITETPSETVANVNFEDMNAEPQIITEPISNNFSDVTFEDLKDEPRVNEEEKFA